MLRNSIGKYIGVILFVFLAKNISKYHIKSAVRKDWHNRGEVLGSIDADISPSTVSDHCGKIEHNNREIEEKSYWFWTKWASVAAATGAIVAAGFAFGAFYEAQRQATAAEEGNRPWIQVSAVDIEVFGYDQNYRNIYVRPAIFLKNSGHSPAKSVYAETHIFLDADEMDFTIDLPRRVCENAAYPQTDYLGIVSFPDQVSYLPGMASRDIDDIKKALAKTNNTSHKISFTEFLKAAHFQLIGCLLYKDIESNIRHTAFVVKMDAADVSPGAPQVKNVKTKIDIFSGSYAD